MTESLALQDLTLGEVHWPGWGYGMFEANRRRLKFQYVDTDVSQTASACAAHASTPARTRRRRTEFYPIQPNHTSM